MNNESAMNENPVPPDAHGELPVFDPERAARLRASVVKHYGNRLRKAERYVCIWLVLSLLFALIAAAGFFQSTTVVQWILCAVVFLVFFQTTVLVKLWYWTVNGKLGLLQEIRLLRLDAKLARSPEESLDAIADLEPGNKPGGLSRGERRIWNGLRLGLALCIGLTPLWPRLKLAVAGTEMTSHRSVVLDEDGNGRMETTYELPNTSVFSLPERAIYQGGSASETEFVPAEQSSWSDGLGRKLAVRREPAGDNVRQVVKLIDPVRPGRSFVLRHVGSLRASRDGDLWTFTVGQNWGYTRDEYFETVALPPGAKFVSATPEPAERAERNGRIILKFRATRHNGEGWEYEIKYRL